MPKTRAEFVNQCLTNLGVVAEGQSISDDMVTKMDRIVDPAFATLNSLDIYYVQDPGELGPSDGNIEDEAFLPLADYVANAACPAFNLPADAKDAGVVGDRQGHAHHHCGTTSFAEASPC